MNDILDVFKTLHSQRERGRLQAQGHRTDDNSMCTLLVIHEANGSWAIHGLGAPGVRLTKERMVALAESILTTAHCYRTDDGVRIHQQAPSRLDGECVVPLRFETCLLDPGDDNNTYLELRVRNLTLPDEFYGLLPLDVVRRLRDQLTAHLDTVQ